MEQNYEVKGVPGKYYGEDGQLKRLVTVEESITVSFVRDVFSEADEIRRKRGEQEQFLPLLLQSCMEPERILLYPAEVEWREENGEEYVLLSSHTQRGKYKRKDVEISYGEYHPSIKKHGCIPCVNCGRC